MRVGKQPSVGMKSFCRKILLRVISYKGNGFLRQYWSEGGVAVQADWTDLSPARCAGVCAHVGVVGGAPPPPQLRSPSGMANSPSVTEMSVPWDGRKKRCSRRLPAPFRPTLASSDAAEQTGVMARGVVPNGRGSGRVHTPKRGPRHLYTREQNLFSDARGGCRLQSGQRNLRSNHN